MQTIEGVVETTFKADHTWVSVGGYGDRPLHGRWRVEGADLIRDIELPSSRDYAGAPTHWREPVIAFIRAQKSKTK
jgi:hypothetical protein